MYEYPRSEGGPHYPNTKPEHTALYEKYKVRADALRGVWFVGRLATYKYYNRDQVVGQALTTFDKIVAEKSPDISFVPASATNRTTI